MDTFESYTLTFVLLGILSVILFITIALAYKKIIPLKYEQDVIIPPFSVDVEFEPYPKTINIANNKDCSATNLQICDVHDPTTVFGCMQLTARCVHFDNDVNYLVEGKKIIIPKNKNINEGYALSIGVISDHCNLYHGDMSLIARSVNSTDYMLVCVCKNPGYLGNVDLLGPCTTVNICNGSIVDINVPLNQIECKCEKWQTNFRYENGLPVCRSMTIDEANKSFDSWSSYVPWPHDRTLATTFFNPTVRDNLNTDKLLNPCRNSILDSSEIPHSLFSIDLQTCKFRDYGIPLQLDLLASPKPLPDGKRQLISIGGAINSTKWNHFRYSDNIQNQRGLCTINTRMIISHFKELSNIQLTFQLPVGVGYSDFSQLSPSLIAENFTGPFCFATMETILFITANFNCKFINLPCIIHEGVPMPPSYDPYELNFREKIFNERYNAYTSLVDRSWSFDIKTGMSINQSVFTEIDSMRNYGIYISVAENESRKNYAHNGLATFNNNDDYIIHKKSISH